MMLLITACLLIVVSAGRGGIDYAPLRLSDFQKLLRSGLDRELNAIVAESQDSEQPDQRDIHNKRRSNMRRRTVDQERSNEYQDSSSSGTSDLAEQMWDNLLQHAWNTAQTIKRDKRKGLSVTPYPEEVHEFPFLVCMRGRRYHSNLEDDDGGVQDIMRLFDKQYEELLLVSSSYDETCLILTTPARKVHQVTESYQGSQTLVSIPLLDITKIQAGTIEEVSSEGWAVPFNENQIESNNMNETEAINQWERVIVVDFVPGLGGMKEESELLDVVNSMMSDVQDMGEVGWLRSMKKEDAEEYLVDESLIGVPGLSDMFSLTSFHDVDNKLNNNNARIRFWRNSLRNGIESEHACSEMFSTLFVKPRAGYYGYDIVLNPRDGPPSAEYESSASNPACVISLIAALSTHPHVLSVKANFPIYHGWTVAQKLDSV